MASQRETYAARRASRGTVIPAIPTTVVPQQANAGRVEEFMDWQNQYLRFEQESKQPSRLLPLRTTRARSCLWYQPHHVAEVTWRLAINDVLSDKVCVSADASDGANVEVMFQDDFENEDLDYDDRELYRTYKQPAGQSVTVHKTDTQVVAGQLINIVTTVNKYVSGHYALGIVSPSAEQMLHPASNFCTTRQNISPPFRAITIGTPGHIAVALWDLGLRRVQFFDSGGSQPDDTRALVDLMTYLFPPGTQIIVVNMWNLQSGYDEFCQTWQWYFVYHRVALNERASTMVDRLTSLSADERLREIRLFWDYLLQLQAARNSVIAATIPSFAEFKATAQRLRLF